MSHPISLISPANRDTAAFYDWARPLYPLVDLFCAPGRRRLIERINREPAGQLLDVGVGPGRHLRLYRGHEVTAIDCSTQMIMSARRHAPQVSARVMDGECLEFAEASFDTVVLCHVLSVTARPEQMLAEVRRVLRPGGRIFVLNHETPRNAWRHVEARLNPLARQLCFRSWFRLREVPGFERFRVQPAGGDAWGLMKAYCLEK